jgi:hypothetical protein
MVESVAINLTRIEQRGCAACGRPANGAVLGCERCGTWMHTGCYVPGAAECRRLGPSPADIEVAATMILCRSCRS